MVTSFTRLSVPPAGSMSLSAPEWSSTSLGEFEKLKTMFGGIFSPDTNRCAKFVRLKEEAWHIAEEMVPGEVR